LSVKITTAELLVPGYDEDAVRYPTAIVADILVDKYSKKRKVRPMRCRHDMQSSLENAVSYFWRG